MDIIGYEGFYKIYDDGRVFSVRSDKFIKPFISRGYYTFSLYKNGKRKNIRIHILLATHFIGERPIGMQIDHIDRNPLNNPIYQPLANAG